MEILNYLDSNFERLFKDGTHFVYQTNNQNIKLDVHVENDHCKVAIMDKESKNLYNEFTIFAVEGLKTVLGIYNIVPKETIKFI